MGAGQFDAIRSKAIDRNDLNLWLQFECSDNGRSPRTLFIRRSENFLDRFYLRRVAGDHGVETGGTRFCRNSPENIGITRNIAGCLEREQAIGPRGQHHGGANMAQRGGPAPHPFAKGAHSARCKHGIGIP